MTDEDIFFTHTVVGQAMSVEMGRRMDLRRMSEQLEPLGLQVSLKDSLFTLPTAWKDWCIIQGAYPYAGLPRRRPGHLRRWLERHALLIAAFGMLMLVSAITLFTLMVWLPKFLT